jgi:tripartite-type tricarboxylate transporter receptor subunit TctC
MRMTRLRDWGFTAIALTALMTLMALRPLALQAQTYPAKTVRIIVPFTPGGGTDFIARLIGAKLSSAWGQQFVVENRVGAGSTLGSEFALKSPPDGYTLLLTSGSYTASPSLYKLRYDPIKDMTPIIQPDDGPFVVSLHPSVPVRSVAQLVTLAKKQPGQINYATSGQGSISHLATELFAMLSGTQFTHVPYKGNGQSIADTMAGQTQMLLAAIAAVIPHVKSGRLRAVAVTSAQRVPALAEVPAVMESGYKFEVSNWHGLMGPRGLPPAIVERLNGEINRVIKDPEFAQRIASDGLVPAGGPPERLLKLLNEEIANWAKVAERTGLKVQ